MGHNSQPSAKVGRAVTKGTTMKDQKISEEMIQKLMTVGITMRWDDGREKTIRITEGEAEQLRQGETDKLGKIAER